MIERPPARKYCITDTELWEIAVAVEMQGGCKEYALKVNKILDSIVSRYHR